MTAKSTMTLGEADGFEECQVLGCSVDQFAALAFTRFPEVIMALGNPSLAQEFELLSARGASVVIEDTADGKLVQVMLRRAGASRPGVSLQCTIDIDHEQAYRLSQGRSICGNSAFDTHSASPGIGSNNVQSVMPAVGFPMQRSSCALVGLRDEHTQKQDFAGADGLACDAPFRGADLCLDSRDRDRTERYGPGVGHSCHLIEDGPSAEPDATDNVKDEETADRGSEGKWLDRECVEGSGVRHLYPSANRFSSEANSKEQSMATKTSTGHLCPLAEELARVNTPHPGADFVGAGRPAHQGWNSEVRKGHVRTVHVRDAAPASAATSPQGQTQPSKKKEQRSDRNASRSCMEKKILEPSTPRSPWSYGPWGRHLQGKVCRTGIPVIAHCKARSAQQGLQT